MSKIDWRRYASDYIVIKVVEKRKEDENAEKYLYLFR